MTRERRTVDHWQELVDHISRTWKAKKKADFEYPFVGRDFRDLHGFVRNFKVWGLMALWDAYLASDNEWVRDKGYSINVFCGCLVWLVDVPGWKGRAKEYEQKLLGPMPDNIAFVIDKMNIL